MLNFTIKRPRLQVFSMDAETNFQKCLSTEKDKNKENGHLSKKNINNLLKKYKGWNLSINFARKLTDGTKLHNKISEKELSTQK